MNVRVIASLVVATLFVSAWPTLAQELEPRSPQSAVPAELIAGTVGGAALGVAGALILSHACLAQAVGWEALACIGAVALGYVIGVPIGSTVGVNVAGSLSGVQGNVLLSALGAIGGEFVGLGFSIIFSPLFEDSGSTGVFAALVVIPFLSSVGATVGYNVAAQMTPEPILELAAQRGSYHPAP
jgi:hypothetical protein